MRNYALNIVVGGCLLLLLAACSVPGIFAGGAANSDISITTGQGSYKTGDTIQVNVTNNLSTPIYAYDAQVGCSILQLSMQAGNNWETINSAPPCTQNRNPQLVKIDPGHTYSTNIASKAGGMLAPGHYRFTLNYASSPALNTSDAHKAQTRAFSTPFEVTAT